MQSGALREKGVWVMGACGALTLRSLAHLSLETLSF